MIKISRLADYATVVMHHLSGLNDCISATQLAEKIQLAVPTVSKVLKQLHEAGLVSSTRGVNGGYQLARSAHKISLAEIITAIDGKPAVTECAKGNHFCQVNASCGVRSNWQVINQIIFNVLDNLTLSDMQKPLSQSIYVPVQFHHANGEQINVK